METTKKSETAEQAETEKRHIKIKKGDSQASREKKRRRDNKTKREGHR